MQHEEKKLDTSDCSFGHITLILSLHYLVKCKSCSLAIYNKDSYWIVRMSAQN